MLPFVKNYLNTASKNPLLSGSIVMIIGTNIYNAGQFFYHSITAKYLSSTYGDTLGKSYYGDVATIISILGLIGIIQLSLGLTVIKFISSSTKQKEVKNLIRWVYHWTVVVGVVVALAMLLLSPFLSKFFNLSQPVALYLLSPILLLTIIINTGRSILQGLLQFGKYVFSFMAEIGVKIILTIILIVAGFAVVGAMGAILIGIVLSYIVVVRSLRPYTKGKLGEKPNIAPLIKYSIPVLAQGISLTSMYSTDLLLVKHYFLPEQAGIYAALAILGRVVFFGVSPITAVMFPLIARKHAEGANYRKILYSSILMLLVVSGTITLVYFFFPQLPLGMLYGESYLEGQSLLWLFGVFMGLLALAMLMSQFYLSVGKTKIVYLFILAALLQILLIRFFHPDLSTVIKLSIASAAILVILLLLYFPYHDRKS